VLEAGEAGFRILASRGDPWLGGDDFDHALANHLANYFWRQHKLELQKRAAEWQRLVWACESAKRTLSTADRVVIELAQIARARTGPLDLRLEITRADFEAMCGELVERSLAVVEETLGAAGVPKERVGRIILTGGLARIPVVRAALARFFQRELDQAVHPDEAICLGAAVKGALLAAQAHKSAQPAPGA
jgi:molecular chaperone DnaK